jgi:exonuclease-1
MGISGLLPLLKSIHKPCNLKKFAGQTIGVDAYVWLHRGTVPCAIDLVLGKPTTKYIDFAMNRIRMLVHFGIIPFLVFDGDHLPSKGRTEKERARKRKESKELGLELLKLGKIAQAHLELQKAIDVTPEMAGLLIQELKKAGIQYIVAPYEADSQLAYLEKKGVIRGILSEDSDLLVFGARVLLTKLDQYGDCIMIRRDDFTACREISLVGWSDQEFRRMAIMGGCDYLANIEKMGLKTAYRLIRKHKTIERVMKAVQFDGKFKVPASYLEDFRRAEFTFLHQWVYCPVEKGLVNLTPPNGVQLEEMPFIGQFVEPHIATGVAQGELHPHTKEPLKLPGNYKPTARRSWPALSKESMAQQVPESKKNKSIDSFFRPTRVPLAELDPNLFAPTTGQQETLRRASGSSWQATPVHTVFPVQPSASLGVHLPPRRAVSDSWTRTPAPHQAVHSTGSQSLVRPSKRQRLCAEDPPLAAPRDSSTVIEGKSPFFGGNLSKKRGMDGSSNIWSDDDALEEALMDLPDPGVFNTEPKKRSNGKSIPIFADELTATEDTSQDTMAMECASLFSQTLDAADTPETEMDSQDQQEKQGQELLESEMESQLGKHLLKKFAYVPRDSGVAGLDFSSDPDTRQVETPELDHQEEDELPTTKDSAWHLGNKTEIMVAASDGVEAETRLTLPAAHTPKDIAPPSSIGAVKGSEDFLVPESSEAEVSSPERSSRGKRKWFDIGRFAYTPR